MRLRLVCGSDNRPIVPRIPQEFGGRPRRAPTRKPLFPAAFLMELAGLEPATSWVRSCPWLVDMFLVSFFASRHAF
jgi:hypothetical protein